MAGVRPVYQVIQTGHGDGWQEAERFWIAEHRKNCDLVNLTDGGDGTPGLTISPEIRQKLSESRRGVPYPPGRVPAMLGKHHSPEAKEKIRLAGTGRIKPESARLKLSEMKKGKPLPSATVAASVAARTGKPLSAEHKAKIAATTTNRKPIVCVETDQQYPSITAAAHMLSVSEASIHQAIRKGCRCKGLHFRLL
jgi:hypothetical protein